METVAPSMGTGKFTHPLRIFVSGTNCCDLVERQLSIVERAARLDLELALKS